MTMSDTNVWLISFMPTIAYFVAILFYNQFQMDGRIREVSNEISVNFAVLFGGIPLKIIVHSLFVAFSKHDETVTSTSLKIINIISGMLLLDTIEFWFHYMAHKIPWMYEHIHYHHHCIGVPRPTTSFVNTLWDIMFQIVLEIFGFIAFGYTYCDFVIVVSLAAIASIADHTTTAHSASRNKYHYVHHLVNSNYNFEQPFFCIWDYIVGTYYPSSAPRIPFVI
eukprot:191913_1